MKQKKKKKSWPVFVLIAWWASFLWGIAESKSPLQTFNDTFPLYLFVAIFMAAVILVYER